MRKRIILFEEEGCKFKAYLENIDTQKVISREDGKTKLEAIGMLVVKHYKDFGLHEVIKIDPILE